MTACDKQHSSVPHVSFELRIIEAALKVNSDFVLSVVKGNESSLKNRHGNRGKSRALHNGISQPPND